MMLVDVWVGDPGSCPSVYNLMKMEMKVVPGASSKVLHTDSLPQLVPHSGINWALAHLEKQIIAD